MPERIVSGGQSGVDRAALDVALELDFPCGGWCPRDRWAEDGRIPIRYPLRETVTEDPHQRTEWNIRDSDATLILCGGSLAGGTLYTRLCSERLGKPWLAVSPESEQSLGRVLKWLDSRQIEVLNIAGPRESVPPGSYRSARCFLLRLLQVS